MQGMREGGAYEDRMAANRAEAVLDSSSGDNDQFTSMGWI